MKKLYLYAFLIIFIFTWWIRFASIKDNNFPITTDQGRDLVDIRGMAVGHKPRLIGPTTSINGVYLGPFWYYFNLPPFVFSGGNPAALMHWQIIWYQLVGLIIFLSVRKADHYLAFFLSLFYLLMPLGFNTSRYFWNANAMPIFTALFLLSCFLFKQKTTMVRALVTGLLAGLALQIEAAFGVVFFPFSLLLTFYITRKVKIHLSHFLGFIITLTPQVIFEIRHQFPLTKIFLAEINGSSNLLGQKLNFSKRLLDRGEEFFRLLSQTSHLSPVYLFLVYTVLLLILVIVLVKNRLPKTHRNFIVINFFFIVCASIFYLIFPLEIKSWYLLGFSIPLVFSYAIGISYIFSWKNILAKMAIIFLVVVSLINTLTAQFEYLAVTQKMGNQNKSSLKNSLLVIDWVYDRANGEGFMAYNYLPSVYDYPYQYLYWWYGNSRYGYVPNDLAYLPNQPEYIENRTSYLTPVRLLNDQTIFLIIESDDEHPEFLSAWLGNFASFCVKEKTKFQFGVEVRKLQRCPK